MSDYRFAVFSNRCELGSVTCAGHESPEERSQQDACMYGEKHTYLKGSL